MQTYTGDKIRKLRKEKGLTQKQLGELCGIADSNIRKYESGKQNPKLETLQKIARALDVPITALRADILPDIRSVSAIVQSTAEVMKNMAESSNQAMSESMLCLLWQKTKKNCFQIIIILIVMGKRKHENV